MKINIKLEEGGKKPIKATKGSDYDCYVRDYEITKEGLVIYYLGFSVEIPSSHRGLILPRSGISNTIYTSTPSVGNVDSDFRGEVQFRIKPIVDLHNREFFSEDIVKSTLPYKKGDRCCQIIFEKKENVVFEIVDKLSDTDRGEGGFNSTGTK